MLTYITNKCMPLEEMLARVRKMHPEGCELVEKAYKFAEEAHRGHGIAGALLGHVCRDMQARGADTLYLVTDHTSFYERYGWEYLCDTECDGGEVSRVYIHRM